MNLSNSQTKAIELDPKMSAAWDTKGASLAGMGRYKEALKVVNKAIELDASISDAWYHKGNSLKALNRTSEADAAFAKAKEMGYKE
jgi:tetratricopeptide (TPR) repeat protein